MKNILVAILLLITCMLKSQNNFMAIGFEGNIPLRDFAASTDLTRHGFATNGFSGDYSGAIFPKKNLGIGGNIRYASISIHENAALKLLSETIPAEFLSGNAPLYTLGFWKLVSVLAGAVYTLPGKSFNFDLFALGGINFAMEPETGVYVKNHTDFYDRSLDVRTLNPAMEAGCALRYHLNATTSVRLNLGWFVSACTGKITEIMEVQDVRTIDKTDYSCPIHTLNAGIGIVYRFHKSERIHE